MATLIKTRTSKALSFHKLTGYLLRGGDMYVRTPSCVSSSRDRSRNSGAGSILFSSSLQKRCTFRSRTNERTRLHGSRYCIQHPITHTLWISSPLLSWRGAVTALYSTFDASESLRRGLTCRTNTPSVGRGLQFSNSSARVHVCIISFFFFLSSFLGQFRFVIPGTNVRTRSRGVGGSAVRVYYNIVKW
jgi:hypothetical protein